MSAVMLSLIFKIIIFLVLIAYFFCMLISFKRSKGVPFVFLSRKQLKIIGEYIKLKPTDKVADLGCGDGRVLRMFERQGVKDLTGYEFNPFAYLSAKIKNKFFKSKAKIYFKNFEKVNLSEFDAVFCYLINYYVNYLKRKFDRELKPGAKLISYGFEIKNWHKPEIIYTNEKNKNLGRVFIYKI